MVSYNPGAFAKNAIIGPLAGIEPVALRFCCSALTNWATDSSCQFYSLHLLKYSLYTQAKLTAAAKKQVYALWQKFPSTKSFNIS